MAQLETYFYEGPEGQKLNWNLDLMQWNCDVSAIKQQGLTFEQDSH
jgi:hypothetical protein